MKQKIEEKLGKEKTEELIETTKKFDKYIKRYRQKVNELVRDLGYEVFIAHSFISKEDKEKILQTHKKE